MKKYEFIYFYFLNPAEGYQDPIISFVFVLKPTWSRPVIQRAIAMLIKSLLFLEFFVQITQLKNGKLKSHKCVYFILFARGTHQLFPVTIIL